MTTPYRRGADFEREVRQYLHERGYLCWRVAGSKGVGGVDLIACRGLPRLYLWVLIQCKINGRISNAEYQKLIRAAKFCHAEAVLAFKSQGEVKLSALFSCPL